MIRQDVGEDRVRVDTPTQNLESYFLDVVKRARAAAAETSGAVSGARVAAYLRGDAEQGRAGDRILERLTAPAAAPSESPTVQMAVAAPGVDHEKLAALAQPTAPLAPATPAGALPDSPAKLDEANQKLSSLLGKPK
jgi:hypothetical protein